MRTLIIITYLSQIMLITLLGCDPGSTENTPDALVVAHPDGGQDMAPTEGMDDGSVMDSGLGNARECEAWFAHNRELVDALEEEMVEACQVGSYGSCAPSFVVNIDCGTSRHVWCATVNGNQRPSFEQGLVDLVAERCQEAPPGCQKQTQNNCAETPSFCMPEGDCVLLEDQADVACDDIRSEVLSAPSTPRQALCDYPERVCEFSIYASCYSDQCRNRCSFLERFACIDGVPVKENKEGIVCNSYYPGNCEGFFDGNVCDVQGQICVESPECAADLCAPDCLATICVDGTWTEVPRREYASDCQ